MKKNIKKKYQAIVSAAAAAVMALSGSMVVMAAPEVIQVNGENTVFDYEYYAANNSDVAAAFGTDREALIQHYIANGMKEGRAAYAPGTDVAALLGTEPQAGAETAGAPAVSWDWIEVDPNLVTTFSVYQGANVSKEAVLSNSTTEGDIRNMNTLDAQKKGRAEAVAAVMAQQVSLGAPAGEFITDMWRYETEWTYQNRTLPYNMRYKIMTASSSVKQGLGNTQMQLEFGEVVESRMGTVLSRVPQNFLLLKSYYIPGYEWRVIGIKTSGASYANGWWSDASADNSSDWQSIDSPFQNAYQFTITQDGVPYTECKMFVCVDDNYERPNTSYSRENISEGVICMLVPKGYTGNAYCHVYPGIEQNGTSVQDTSRRVTFVLPKKATEKSLQGWINVISN